MSAILVCTIVKKKLSAIGISKQGEIIVKVLLGNQVISHLLPFMQLLCIASKIRGSTDHICFVSLTCSLRIK